MKHAVGTCNIRDLSPRPSPCARSPSLHPAQHYIPDQPLGLEATKSFFGRFGLADPSVVVFLKGFFSDTVPTADFKRLAMWAPYPTTPTTHAYLELRQLTLPPPPSHPRPPA